MTKEEIFQKVDFKTNQFLYQINLPDSMSSLLVFCFKHHTNPQKYYLILIVDTTNLI